MNQSAAVLFKWGERTFIYNKKEDTVYLAHLESIAGLASEGVEESLYHQAREEYRKTSGGGVDLEWIYDGLDELDDKLRSIHSNAENIYSIIEAEIDNLERDVTREIDSIQNRIIDFMKEVKGKGA